MATLNQLNFLDLTNELIKAYLDIQNNQGSLVERIEEIQGQDIVSVSKGNTPYSFVRKENGELLDFPYARYFIPSEKFAGPLRTELGWIEIRLSYHRPENAGKGDFTKADQGYIETRIVLREHSQSRWSRQLENSQGLNVNSDGRTLIIRSEFNDTVSPYRFSMQEFNRHATYVLGLHSSS